MRPFGAVLLGGTLLLGCAVGEGEGVVVGSLWIPGCDGDEDLGEQGSQEEDFDLDADYYAAQLVLDPDQDEDNAHDSLSIRVQRGGSGPEISDALSIQVIDVAAIATDVAEEVRPDGGVRASLSLALRCPDAFENLQARAADAAGPCPEEAITGVWSDDFDDPAAFRDRDPFWDPEMGTGHPSCIAFHEIGTDFGDEIVAAFHFNLRDGRASEGDEERVHGFVRGRFRFTLERGAQQFP